MKRIKKVLLSPNNVDEEEVQKLAQILEENECEVEVTKIEMHSCENTEENDQLISEEIDNCEIVFVLIGAETEDSVCLEKQVITAEKQDKKIVGIYMGGTADNVPKSLEQLGDGLITNDVIKIVKVLDNVQIPWETPEGEYRNQKNTMDKGECN